MMNHEAAVKLAVAMLEAQGLHMVARNVNLGGKPVDAVVDDGPTRQVVVVVTHANEVSEAEVSNARKAVAVLEQHGCKSTAVRVVRVLLYTLQETDHELRANAVSVSTWVVPG